MRLLPVVLAIVTGLAMDCASAQQVKAPHGTDLGFATSAAPQLASRGDGISPDSVALALNTGWERIELLAAREELRNAQGRSVWGTALIGVVVGSAAGYGACAVNGECNTPQVPIALGAAVGAILGLLIGAST